MIEKYKASHGINLISVYDLTTESYYNGETEWPNFTKYFKVPFSKLQSRHQITELLNTIDLDIKMARIQNKEK